MSREAHVRFWETAEMRFLSATRLWQYGSSGKGVAFDFRMGRDRQGPKQLLGQFAGILQTDGYSVYARDVGGAGMTHAACLAHARRRFIEAIKVNAKDLDSVRIVELMDALFTIDREARDQRMAIEQRHALRQERAPKLI
jgi:transposase